MKKLTRREFLIKTPPALLAAASLTGALSSLSSCSSDSSGQARQPNILLIMVDQMQTPPEGYGPEEGVAQGLKEILGFRPLSPDNPYTKYFPGLLRLRRNAVVMRKHHTASSACVPSRTCIMTGQYPTMHGVSQTDGLFKSADDVPWLDPDGLPTIGDWFRAIGYSTHYFGKWHVSDPDAPDYLKPWGFADWEQSSPEPHGGTADNSGAFRDVEFAKNVESFLAAKGKDTSSVPWLAVGSLVNPHDCSLMPINWEMPGTPADPHGTGVVQWNSYPPPLKIPIKGETSRMGGTDPADQYQVELNPDGFPQDNGKLPPTYTESLDDKPQCHKDYSLKWGLAFAAKTDSGFIGKIPVRSPLPFQLQGENAQAWSLAYNQFYTYLHYLTDLQIRKMLNALDDNKLTDNTIVVFLSDHGEMTGAHGGMIQKWHNAYEETIRVPMVVSSPLVNSSKTAMREITHPTSSIDLAPTLLGLAGYHQEQIRQIMATVAGKPSYTPFAGADLSDHILGKKSGPVNGPDGRPRPGALFMSNDTITEKAAYPPDPLPDQYNLFLQYVENAINNGAPLVSGPVRQPNNVRALCTGDWKIARYVDPRKKEADQWELYCLTNDPIERINLVDFRTGEVRNDVAVPPGMTRADLVLKNRQLQTDLAAQETALL